jgi:hypothetical protein
MFKMSPPVPEGTLLLITKMMDPTQFARNAKIEE